MAFDALINAGAAYGPKAALDDRPRLGKQPTITAEAASPKVRSRAATRLNDPAT
jgi:hypothetical protein